MKKMMSRYFIFFALACMPLEVSATEQAVKEAHKPPILTNEEKLLGEKQFQEEKWSMVKLLKTL